MGIIWKSKKTKEDNIYKMDRKWKEGNKLYLRELQNFLDRVDSIEDYELRKSVTNQMMICDKVLTELAEAKFIDFYDQGYKCAKNG